jgi:hypothetical protein
MTEKNGASAPTPEDQGAGLPTLAEQVARLRARVRKYEAEAERHLALGTRDMARVREQRLVALTLAEVARAMEGER